MQRTAFRSCLRPLQAIPRPLQASELVARRSFASVSAPRPKSLNVSRIGLGLGLAGSLAYWSTQKPLLCDVLADPAIPAPTAAPGDFPQSNVSLYSLGFGTAAGICAGVFVAKGLKMIAFFLGGLFVLTQYTTSKSLTEVNWGAMGKRYTTAVDAVAGGDKTQPVVPRLFNRFTGFLTANFPERATFLAGFVLGLRLG